MGHTTRISGSLSCGAREVRSPCAWRGPGPNFPLQGRQGSRGCIPGSPGESGTVSPFRAEQGTSLETPWRARAMDVSLSELRQLVMDREAWRAAIHIYGSMGPLERLARIPTLSAANGITSLPETEFQIPLPLCSQLALRGNQLLSALDLVCTAPDAHKGLLPGTNAKYIVLPLWLHPHG